eukprot:scaffold101263_cov66-Phaeocystis_antarctica.AAC.3
MQYIHLAVHGGEHEAMVVAVDDEQPALHDAHAPRLVELRPAAAVAAEAAVVAPAQHATASLAREADHAVVEGVGHEERVAQQRHRPRQPHLASPLAALAGRHDRRVLAAHGRGVHGRRSRGECAGGGDGGGGG